jgi:hypothetical protein
MVWFEYHCWESPKSGDAELWYRSHQRVTILGVDPEGEVPEAGSTFKSRCADAVQAVYKIQFSDGYIDTAFEDELLDSQDEFERPDPPARGAQA